MSRAKALFYVSAGALWTWAAVLAAPRPVFAQSAPVFLLKWGQSGNNPPNFMQPQGVAASNSGDVLTADYGNWHVQRFTSTGQYVHGWGVEDRPCCLSRPENDPLCCLSRPDDIAVDDSLNVYINTPDNREIWKFRLDGSFVQRWTVPITPYAGPEGIGVDPAGRLFAVGYRSVFVFDLTGNLLFSWPGSSGLSDVAISARGDVYITDAGAHQVHQYASDGRWIRSWGRGGTGNGEFDGPSSVAIGPDGYVYVADRGNDRIQFFTPEGTFVAAWGRSGLGDGEFNHPEALAIDGRGDIYVADTGHQRIQKFGFLATATWQTSWGALKGRYR